MLALLLKNLQNKFVIKNILRKIRLISNARKEPYFLFQKVLGFYPDKIAYYQLAVRHKSVSIPTDNGLFLSNERLEFLGDAILNSVVTDILYHSYENEREGFLTETRSKLVKRSSLNKLALEIGVDKLMKTTQYVNANNNENIYGNALEALMGAIYLDYGYKQCKLFVEHRLFSTFVNMDEVTVSTSSHKSKLIEWCQKYHVSSEFELLQDKIISANRHVFKVQLSIGGKIICEAMGSSKKEAQQNAARIALEMIDRTPNFLAEIIQKKV